MTSLAVIGVGHWGRNLVRNFSTLGALAAVCEPAEAGRAEVRETYPGVAVHEGVGSVLDDPAIEAVVIATPAETHGALAREALAAGKHVFVEKPICLDLDEAAALREEAARRGRVLMVGHMLRYHPAFVALSQCLASGTIGTLRYIYSNRLSLGKIRREENALWSFAPHDISMILALAGSMPARVAAHGESYLTPGVADTTLTHLTFSDQAQAHIFVSWLHPYKEHRLVVVGSEGMVVFNDAAAGPDKLLHYPHQVGWEEGLPSINRAEARPLAYAADEPLRLECAHFIKCIEEGLNPTTDADEAIRVLRVLDASQRALVGGEPVTLDAES